MDWISWLIVIIIGLVALGRRAGAIGRGLNQLQQQANLQQARARGVVPPGAAPPRATVTAPSAPPPRPAPGPTTAPRRQPEKVPAWPAPPAAATPLRRSLGEAFGDPSHARVAVVLAEVLGPPKALR